MYTERVRDEASRAIFADPLRTRFYSPLEPSQGYVAAPGEIELHFTAHTNIPDPGNFPTNTVWLHMNFRDVVDLSEASAVEPFGKLSTVWGRLKSQR